MATTNFDTFAGSSFPMAWPPQMPMWSGQPATPPFEQERPPSSSSLLAQLGLVPAQQALPTGGSQSNTQTQAMLSTTVVPPRLSKMASPQQSSVDTMGVGSLEPGAHGHPQFTLSASRYQPFGTPDMGQQVAGPEAPADVGHTGSTTSGAGKQFRFNPNAAQFVPLQGDRFNECVDMDTVSAVSRAREANVEEAGSGDAAAVSAAVACAVIGSPTSGPAPAPVFSNATQRQKASSYPGGNDLPQSKLWCHDSSQCAPSTAPTVWPPSAVVTPLGSLMLPLNALDGYSSPMASPALQPVGSLSPTLEQLRGTAHSVAQAALPSPDMGPAAPPTLDVSLPAGVI